MSRLLRNAAWLTVTVRCAECSRTAQCDVRLSGPNYALLDPGAHLAAARSWELPADEGSLEVPADWSRVPLPDGEWSDLLCPTCSCGHPRAV